MVKTLKGVGTAALSLAIILGVIALAIFFIKGGLWLAPRILPWLSITMWLVLTIDVLVILPLAFFKKTMSLSSVAFYVSSYVYGITLWFWGFLLTYAIWGLVAVVIGLFFAGIGVVPIAMVATAMKGEWSAFGSLLLLVFLTFGSRALALYLAEKAERYLVSLRWESNDEP